MAHTTAPRTRARLESIAAIRGPRTTAARVVLALALTIVVVMALGHLTSGIA